MSLYVLDTDILSLYWEGDASVVARVDACAPTDLAITVITVEEQMTGWYDLLRQARRPPDVAHAYQRLGDCVHFLGRWRILPYTEPAMDRVTAWQRQKLNIRKMDLRIAAITLEHNGILVTRNLRDFQRIPGLTVENWAA
jgi:tRNA(fMet)-specific endonuclease VapC